MASTGLLALIDDITTLLDDVAILTKVAAKKTAGVLGDDLALNAQQVAGVKAEREIPVVWAVAKGSAVNKLILVPAALALSAFLPWLIIPLLMLGGAYLCYEGFEKVSHKILHKETNKEQEEKIMQALTDPNTDMAEFEKQKIKGAIRTDFILSAEIIVIALGVAQSSGFLQQLGVLTTIAFGITIFVYGSVAAIVKLDDAGLYLMNLEGSSSGKSLLRSFGKLLLRSCPYLMRTLSIVGTAAMFLVGGGILLHGIPGAHEFVHHANEMPLLANIPDGLRNILWNAVCGIVAGGIFVGLVDLIKKWVGK